MRIRDPEDTKIQNAGLFSTPLRGLKSNGASVFGESGVQNAVRILKTPASENQEEQVPRRSEVLRVIFSKREAHVI